MFHTRAALDYRRKNDACSFISLHSITTKFVGPTGSGSEGITIWYRVDSEESYAEELENFTGKSTVSLREALKIEKRAYAS